MPPETQPAAQPKTPTQESASIAQLFDQALALQQQQNWDPALEAYQKLLKQDLKESASSSLNASQAAVVYHNMSVIAGQKGDLLKAYAWAKKSLTLNPGNQSARKLYQEYSKKFEVPLIPHQITNFDNFKNVISVLSVDAWLILSLVLILTTLWLILKNFLTNKKNQLANNFSGVSKLSLYLMSSVTVFVLSTTYVRYLDFSTLRGIIVAEKASVQTAPGENKSVIFEAPAGLELEILKSDQGYYQVRYPGAFSGWIDNSKLEVLGLNFRQRE